MYVHCKELKGQDDGKMCGVIITSWLNRKEGGGAAKQLTRRGKLFRERQTKI